MLELFRRIRLWLQNFPQRVFDWRFRVDTAGITRLHYADLAPDVGKSGYCYEATSKRVFERMMRSIDVDYLRFTFVDVGCGKGAVLLYACELAFKRIIGIEVSPTLQQVAQANISRYPRQRVRCANISVVCADGAAFGFPDDPLIVYLYNPFDEATLSRMFAMLHRSLCQHPREIIIVSYNPDCAFYLDGSSGFAPSAAQNGGLIKEGTPTARRASRGLDQILSEDEGVQS